MEDLQSNPKSVGEGADHPPSSHPCQPILTMLGGGRDLLFSCLSTAQLRIPVLGTLEKQRNFGSIVPKATSGPPLLWLGIPAFGLMLPL